MYDTPIFHDFKVFQTSISPTLLRYNYKLVTTLTIQGAPRGTPAAPKKGETMEELKEIMNTCKEFFSMGFKAANEAEKKDKDEAKNEKVDKRKLIDEVGGILKGKVDDELIRIIIKKMEEASYNDSEAGTADNEEDEKDKEKEAKNKCKNEDKEDKKDKAENEDEEEKEDKEEDYEDYKEKVKEIAENKKAKNSMDEMTKKLFQGGERKKNKIYMSQKEGIELGRKLY